MDIEHDIFWSVLFSFFLFKISFAQVVEGDWDNITDSFDQEDFYLLYHFLEQFTLQQWLLVKLVGVENQFKRILMF